MKKRLTKTILFAALTGLLSVLLPGCADTGADRATLSFRSFDGGGPEYSVSIDDKDILSFSSDIRYDKANHAELNGAGYDVIYTFTGLKEGKTTVTVTGSSPITEEEKYIYEAIVDGDLSVAIKQTETRQYNNGEDIYEEETT